MVGWFLLVLGCVRMIYGIDVPKLGWMWKFPEEFPIHRSNDLGWDFRINRSAMSWSWNLPVPTDIERDIRDPYQPLGQPFVVMELSAYHLGWLGCGVCRPRLYINLTEGKMQNCDLVMAWVDTNGVGQICDAWSNSNEPPQMDLSQDWRLLSAAQVNGSTTVVISRDMVTKDERDLNFWQSLLFVWAHGNNTKKLKKTNASLCNLPLHHHKNANIYDEHAVFMWDPMIRPRDVTPSPHPHYARANLRCRSNLGLVSILLLACLGFYGLVELDFT